MTADVAAPRDAGAVAMGCGEVPPGAPPEIGPLRVAAGVGCVRDPHALLGPRDLVHAATSVKDGVTDAVDDVTGLLELITRGRDLMDRAEALVTAAEDTLARADRTLHDASALRARADRVLGEAEGLVRRGDALLAPAEELGAKALPIAARIVDSVEPDEVEAVVRTIDRLPVLVTLLEENVLPVVARLDEVGPDVRAILDAVTDLSHGLRGLPGMGLLQRRGERKDEGPSDA